LGGSSTTFYWFNIGGQPSVNYTVRYTASFSDGSSVLVTANFTVEGPTNPQVQSAIGFPDVLGFNGPPPYYALALGHVPPGYGVTFSAAVVPPADFPGNFVWVQVIGNITITWVPTAGQFPPCSAVNALDFGFPYTASVSPPDPTKRVDSPGMALATNGLSAESYQMSSQMYLMWQPTFNPPGSQPTIQVPLGTIPWQWTGNAQYNAAVPPAFWVPQGNNVAGPNPPVFQPAEGLVADFPTWGPVFNFAQYCPKPPGTYAQ